MQETQVGSMGQENPLEKEMATHSSIFAWETPWIEEPGGLQFMGSQRVKHNLATKKKKKQILCVSTLVKGGHGASLVVQQLRICHVRQGTWVQSLLRKDPTCPRATKSPCATTTEPLLRAWEMQLLKPTRPGVCA